MAEEKKKKTAIARKATKVKKSNENRRNTAPLSEDTDYSVNIFKPKDQVFHSTKDNLGVCKFCGQPFKQDFMQKLGIYTKYQTCHECRALRARGKQRFTLPYAPHKTQIPVHESKARFKVLKCGIRWGKDRCSIMEGILKFGQMLNEERPDDMTPKVLWWIIAPTLRIARQNWREIRAYLPREWVTNFSVANQTIETINGGVIEVHSADDPESLVAVPLDLVTITEAARIKYLETVWDNIEGRLNSPGRGPNGQGGLAIINSSPIGRNYFHKMWTWGQKNHPDYDPLWESWQFSTWDNPYMAAIGDRIQANGRTYRENLQRRMSKRKYLQDYMGESLAEASAMFPGFKNNCVVKPSADMSQAQIDRWLREWEKPDPYETYKIGYDPAKSVDRSPLVIRDSKGKIAKVIIMEGMGWDRQWDLVATYSALYNNATIAFGKTGLGETIESQLVKRGLITEPINEQGLNKERLVENLAVLVEQGVPKFAYDNDIIEMVIFEFEDYEYRMTEKGRVVYSNASSDGHDDIVMACAFAFHDFVLPELQLPFVGLLGNVGASKHDGFDMSKYVS
jgi:hypothetical protein